MAEIRTYTVTLQGEAEDIDRVIAKLEDELECVGAVLETTEHIENAEDNPEENQP